MSDTPFSDLIRAKRREHGLSQDEVAKATAGRVPQATLSSWERAELLPRSRTRQAQIDALAEVLRVPATDLLSALSDQELAEAQSFLTDEGYLIEQRKYIESAGSGVAVWLLGPETLPVQRSPLVRDEWIRNLQSGIPYRIIWLLCLVHAGTLPRLAKVLRDIGEKVSETPGHENIEHFPYVLFPDNDIEGEQTATFVRNNEDFGSLSDEQIPANTFHKIQFRVLQANERGHSDGIRENLASYYTRLGSLTVCKPSGMSREAFASIHFPRVKFSRRLTSKEAWHILDTDDAMDLAHVIDKFERTIRQQTADRIPK